MLRIEHLSFWFGPRQILADISIDCGSGEIIGIVGRSGIGKTTLLNVAAGILPCQSGTVLVNRTAPRIARSSQKIGYLFQSPTLLPWLTCEQNVALPLQLRRNSSDGQHRTQAAVRAALERAQIAEARCKYPHELSGGMQTRAALARALVYEPGLLLMDEPFNGLDDLVKEKLCRDLQNVLADSHTASVLVTHNLSEAVLLCDRVYVLGTETPEGACRVLRCERIPFSRPRDTALLNEPEFAAARKRVREALV